MRPLQLFDDCFIFPLRKLFPVFLIFFVGCTHQPKSDSDLRLARIKRIPARSLCISPGGHPSDVFDQHCSQCHKARQDMVGPALMNIGYRDVSLEWFSEFLKNEDSLIRSNDSVTLEINSFWDFKHNLDYDSLSPRDVRELWTYSTGW